MKQSPILQILLVVALVQTASAINTPTNLVSRLGEGSIVLHWDQVTDPTLDGYDVYRASSSNGTFTLLSNLVPSAGYCDLTVIDGRTNYYQVTAVVHQCEPKDSPSAILAAVANPFTNMDQFLDFVQETDFDYFWYLANPLNGLVPDRSETSSTASIAALWDSHGLTAIGIAIDHGWITRTQGVARVKTTLNTFLTGPQGPAETGVIGYNGWFYHFLYMTNALRANSELSTIDTSLLLAGILYDKQYFDGTNADETSIRNHGDRNLQQRKPGRGPPTQPTAESKRRGIRTPDSAAPIGLVIAKQ